jgi:transposase
MANRKESLSSWKLGQVRNFSDSFKSKKVGEIESGMTKVSEIVKEYRVSYTSVYRWIQKYGTMKKKPPRLIVESESDTKKLLELKKRVAELERLVGQKQILIDFKDKMIELAEEHYNIDIKKNFSTLSSSDAGKKGKS